jgi:hypothetical protein
MQRLLEEVADRGLLGDLGRVHDHDALGGLGDDAHVVGDQHDRHLELVLELVQELEDLGLDRDVERRRGLVGDEELRVARQRHGDHDALAHAARELVRVLLHAAVGVGDVHELQHLDRLVHGRPPAQPFMEPQGLGDLLAAGEHGVERRHRLLEDHRDFFAANLPHLAGGQIHEVPAVVEDLALDDLARGRRDQLHDAERRHGLAAAGLAHDPEGLAFLDVQVHAVHGADDALVGEEVRLEVLDVQQALDHRVWAPLTRAS